MQKSFEEEEAFGLGGGELGLQLVAQSHKFIDFGHDAVLFGEGRRVGRLGNSARTGEAGAGSGRTAVTPQWKTVFTTCDARSASPSWVGSL